MRWAQINVGANLTLDLPRRPGGVGTFVVKTTSGAATQTSSAPTLDAVNTTLSGAVVAGASTLNLTSGSGVVVGRRYLVGGSESTGGEMITVKAYAANVATLVRPIRSAQPSGATFQGTRLTFAVTGASVSAPQRNMRVEWTPASGDEDLATALPFDALRYAPVTFLSTEDLRDLDPLLVKRLSSGVWLPAVAERAWTVLLGHISQKIDPGGVVGTVDLTLAHGYLTRALIAETGGKSEENDAYLTDLRERYVQERDNALAALAYDAAQTGNAKNGASGWSSRSIRMVRT
ncbi:MAG: hypothetical protein IPQ07_38060 [Myxococcales bacterium]|nr:hypothetical protein [Myxococcales bacterium]